MRDVRIVVCPRCQGTGTLEMATGDEDRCKTIFCPLCNGMRVLKRTVTIEYNVVNNAHESEKEYPSLEPVTGKKMENRPRSREEYHSARWTRESKVFREKHPLCAICLEKGLLVPSEVVDHIIPVAVCSDFWDKTNWQALCRKCNIEKGNKDKRLINGR